MTTTQAAKLSALQNRSTTYEIAIEKNGARKLLGYTKLSGAAVRRCVYRNAVALCAFAGADVLHASKRTDKLAPATSHTLGDCRIFATGRTHREAVISGELPHFLTVGA